jgi:predicted transcriptional regulator
MAKGKTTTEIQKLVRTSVLVPEEVDASLRLLADKGKRPLSWEIRQALENHVEAEMREAA